MTSKNLESSSWFPSSDGEILFIFYRINFDEVSNLIVVDEMHNFNMARKHGMVVTVDSVRRKTALYFNVFPGNGNFISKKPPLIASVIIGGG